MKDNWKPFSLIETGRRFDRKTSDIQSLSQSFDSSLANNLIDLPEFVEEIGREFNVPPQTETLAT